MSNKNARKIELSSAQLTCLMHLVDNASRDVYSGIGHLSTILRNFDDVEYFYANGAIKNLVESLLESMKEFKIIREALQEEIAGNESSY